MNAQPIASRSLKFRLTVSALLSFLAGIVGLSLYATQALRVDMQRMLGEQQQSTASILADQVNRTMAERIRALELVAATFSNIDAMSPSALQQQLDQRVLLHRQFNAGVLILNVDGVALAEGGPTKTRIGRDYSAEEAVATALHDGHSAIGTPTMGPAPLAAPEFQMAAPIRNARGKIIGSLMGSTTLGRPNFLDDIMAFKYGKTGGYAIAEPRRRIVITASDRRRVMEALPGLGVSPMRDRFLDGFEGSLVLATPAGLEVLASSRVVPISGWIMFVNMPTEEAFATIRDMQRRMVFATLLSTLIVAGLTWWMLRREFAPLVTTVSALERMSGTGARGERLPLVRNDEIGALIRAFNGLLDIVEERERALAASENSLSITLQSIGDAVITTDAAGLVARMNPVAERLSGWPLSEAAGKPLSVVFDIIDTQTRARAISPAAVIMRGSEVVNATNRTTLLSRGGQEYPIHDSAAPIRNQASEIVGVVVVFSDVSEQYREQAARQLSESHLRLFIEFAPVSLAMFDTEMRYLHASRRWRDDFGPAEMVIQGLSHYALFPGGISEEWKAIHRRGLGGEIVRAEEDCLVRQDGSIQWLRWEVRPWFREVGNIGGILIFSEDITARKESEENLVHENRKFAAAFQNSVMGLVLSDSDGGDIVMNPAALNFHGFSSTEDMHLRVGDYAQEWELRDTGGSLIPYANWPLVRAVRGDYVRDVEILFRKLDTGQEHIFSITNVPVLNSNGTVSLIVQTLLDVTDRERAKQALRVSLTEKEALLKEVHHRVKNNLQVITSLLRLESGRSTHSDTRDVLGDMQGRIRSMALLHETLYRTETFAAVDLGGYIKQLATQAFRAFATGSGNIKLQLELAVVHVGMDVATPCGLLVNELISNCFKHGFPDARSGVVRVELQMIDDAAQALLRVSDTGVGLPADFAQRRATSLGLELVGDLAIQMGGRLDIEPPPNGAFVVRFSVEPFRSAARPA